TTHSYRSTFPELSFRPEGRRFDRPGAEESLRNFGFWTDISVSLLLLLVVYSGILPFREPPCPNPPFTVSLSLALYFFASLLPLLPSPSKSPAILPAPALSLTGSL